MSNFNRKPQRTADVMTSHSRDSRTCQKYYGNCMKNRNIKANNVFSVEHTYVTQAALVLAVRRLLPRAPLRLLLEPAAAEIRAEHTQEQQREPAAHRC